MQAEDEKRQDRERTRGARSAHSRCRHAPRRGARTVAAALFRSSTHPHLFRTTRRGVPQLERRWPVAQPKVWTSLRSPNFPPRRQTLSRSRTQSASRSVLLSLPGKADEFNSPPKQDKPVSKFVEYVAFFRLSLRDEDGAHLRSNERNR